MIFSYTTCETTPDLIFYIISITFEQYNENPLVIGIATNDGLSTSLENIGKLISRKNIYFIPFRQDNPITKPHSLMFEPNYILNTVLEALNGMQIQPILL